MNIGEWITKRAIIHPDKPFLEEKNKKLSNRHFNEQVNKTAHALGDLGIAKGDRVALLMSNCAEFLEIFFACAKTGDRRSPDLAWSAGEHSKTEIAG